MRETDSEHQSIIEKVPGVRHFVSAIRGEDPDMRPYIPRRATGDDEQPTNPYSNRSDYQSDTELSNR